MKAGKPSHKVSSQTFYHLFEKTIRHYYKIHLGPFVKIPSGGGGGGLGQDHLQRQKNQKEKESKIE